MLCLLQASSLPVLSSRSCLILAFGYASFMMGTLYYLLHLIILGHGPQVFYVAECSWMAAYFFFLSLLIFCI